MAVVICFLFKCVVFLSGHLQLPALRARSCVVMTTFPQHLAWFGHVGCAQEIFVVSKELGGVGQGA